jgi:phosphoglycolate phosphatase-like HAD superfamily hydrolase
MLAFTNLWSAVKKDQKFIFSMFLMLLAGSCTPKKEAGENLQQDSVLTAAASDPLPSWNEGPSKRAITSYITKVTEEGGAEFIPVSDRIACFDNDGTLWSEQPLYFQFVFALDRVKELAPQHPEWKTKEPFASVLKGDVKAALAGGEKALIELVIATQTGMSAAEFEKQVHAWMTTAEHPKFKKHYNQLTFLPMVELLNYLRSKNFKTFIVSGGDEAFMRPWAEQAYGIPSEQIIGTSMKTMYVVSNDTPAIMRTAALNFLDDKEGKPVAINDHIGKIPVFAAGNSDGDYAMLQYTTTATGYPRFGMFVHHTDSVREWSYDRTSHIGKLDKGLDDAGKYGWLIVDMKNDWKEIFIK